MSKKFKYLTAGILLGVSSGMMCKLMGGSEIVYASLPGVVSAAFVVLTRRKWSN